MRYFVGFLITMGLIILVIVLLVRGGQPPAPPTTTKTIDSYATTDAAAILTIDGRINASVKHQQIRITVDRNNVTYEQISGYEGLVTKMERYENNERAFSNFLLALSHAGFTQGENIKALRDERGQCPQGQRYVFELRQGAKEIQRYWTSTCGSPKTYLGALDLSLQLFQEQVPNYEDLTDNIEL